MSARSLELPLPATEHEKGLQEPWLMAAGGTVTSWPLLLVSGGGMALRVGPGDRGAVLALLGGRTELNSGRPAAVRELHGRGDMSTHLSATLGGK